MTRCPEFYEKLERDGNFCGLSPSEVSRIKAYRELIDKISKQGIDRTLAYEYFPAGAAREITSLKDDEIRIRGLNHVVSCLKRGEKVTAEDVKKSLQSAHEKLPFVKSPREKLERTTKPPLPVETPPETSAPLAPFAAAMKAKFTPPENKPALAEQAKRHLIPCPIQPTSMQENCKSLSFCYLESGEEVLCCRLNGKTFDDLAVCPTGKSVTDLPTELPWNCGVAPCPDGQDHIEVEKIRGKVCHLLSIPCNQLKKERCPVIERVRKAKEQGFVPAADIDPATGGKFIKLAPVKITHKPEVIQFWPSGKQWEFIHRIIKTGEYDKPDEVVSAAVDSAMLQEAGV